MSKPETPRAGSSRQPAQPRLQHGWVASVDLKFQSPGPALCTEMPRPCYPCAACLGTLSLHSPPPLGASPHPRSCPGHPLSPGTPANQPSSNIREHCTGSRLRALTLEGGPLARVPMPAPLHEVQELAAAAWPGSADGRQLRAVALRHLHHDVQEVSVICEGKARASGRPGLAPLARSLSSRRDHSCGKVPRDTGPCPSSRCGLETPPSSFSERGAFVNLLFLGTPVLCLPGLRH